MGKQSKRERKLEALRFACETTIQLTQKPNADPLDLLRRLMGVCLLMDPELGNPATHKEALQRFTEMTLLRLQEAAAEYEQQTQQRSVH